MVLSVLSGYQLVDDDAQLHPARVSIGAYTEDGSVSCLADILIIAVLVLEGANTKAFLRISPCVWRFRFTALAAVIVLPLAAKLLMF
jgi:hypothetical protein